MHILKILNGKAYTIHGLKRSIIRQKFVFRVYSILRSHLYTTNKIKAINTFPICVLSYSFRILKWITTNLNKLSRSITTDILKPVSYTHLDVYKRQV